MLILSNAVIGFTTIPIHLLSRRFFCLGISLRLFTPRHNYETALEIPHEIQPITSAKLHDFMATIAEYTHYFRSYYPVVYKTKQAEHLFFDQNNIVLAKGMSPRSRTQT